MRLTPSTMRLDSKRCPTGTTDKRFQHSRHARPGASERDSILGVVFLADPVITQHFASLQTFLQYSPASSLSQHQPLAYAISKTSLPEALWNYR